jgi:hypothetical protein
MSYSFCIHLQVLINYSGVHSGEAPIDQNPPFYFYVFYGFFEQKIESIGTNATRESFNCGMVEGPTEGRGNSML